MKRLLTLLALFCASAGIFAADDAAIDKKAVAELNKQGLSLFGKLCEADASGNVFVSPFSVGSAFGMVYAGSKNATQTQIAKALGFPADVKASSELLAKIMKSYEPADAKKRAAYISNSVWVTQGRELLPAYTDTVTQYFGGAFFREDFKQSASLVKKINAYVEDHTDKMIKDMLSPNDIDANQQMILLNTLYFNATWQNPFNARRTQDLQFHKFGGATITTPMMNQETRFPYFSSAADNVHGVVLYYEQQPFEMVLLKPQRNDNSDNGAADLKKIIASLPEKLDAWRQSARSQKVNLTMPKLKLTGKYDLIPTLKKLGMIDAFTKDADFTGICEKRDMYINFVLHQTALELDEKSTKAAAATAVGMNRMMAGPPENSIEFNVDRPFIAVIRDHNTGNVLFVGRITEPKK